MPLLPPLNTTPITLEPCGSLSSRLRQAEAEGILNLR